MSGRAVTAVPTKAKRVAKPHMSEDALLSAVLDLAELRGWRRYHQRPNRLGQIVQGDRGFPDLVLCRPVTDTPSFMPPRVLFVELKAQSGRVSPEQQRWLDALGGYGCVWRPRDWYSGEIERALR